MHILIVEDDVRLSQALKQILIEKKYMVDTASNGFDGLDYAMTGIYDVIVLDVMLPQLNGFDVVAKLRESNNKTPVLMLTAKDSISDKVNGLDSGADDYMTKPFSLEELLARIRALSRRQGEVVLDTMQFEDLTLSISTCDLQQGVKSVHLNFKEFEIMKLLMSNPHATVNKDSIITKVWGYDSDAEDNNVEAYISFLRKKLLFLGSSVSIKTLRKIGYKLERK